MSIVFPAFQLYRSSFHPLWCFMYSRLFQLLWIRICHSDEKCSKFDDSIQKVQVLNTVPELHYDDISMSLFATFFITCIA